MDLFKHHQKSHPPTSFTSCSQWLGVCVLTIFHLKRLFKLLWQPQQCSLVTAIEVIMLFCPVLPGRYYLRHTAERQISFTEAGVMASWKNPIKKKSTSEAQGGLDGSDTPASPCSVCSVTPSLVLAHAMSYANWEQLPHCFCSVWSNSLGFKSYWVCWIFLFSRFSSKLRLTVSSLTL